VFQYVAVGDSATRAGELKLVCSGIVAGVEGTYSQMYESLKVDSGFTVAER